MEEHNFNCDLIPDFNVEDDCEEDQFLNRLVANVYAWVTYYRIAEHDACEYYSRQRRRIRRFPFSRNGHMFMMEAMGDTRQMCYQKFRMYPEMLRYFAHVLRDEHGLCCNKQVDIDEQVGMFMCVLACEKGYRQVTAIFNHSLQTVCHYVKEVLRAVVALSRRMIRPSPNYDDGVKPHRSDMSKHPLFGDCICAIDGMHVKVMLPRHERINFIGQKGVPTQNVLTTVDFNLCFTFVLARTHVLSHDARIFARTIHSPYIHFLLLVLGKYYLVNFGFAYWPEYMTPYKGLIYCTIFSSFMTNERDVVVHFVMLGKDSTSDTRPAKTS